MANKALSEIDLSKAGFVSADDSETEHSHDATACETWCDYCDFDCVESCDND